MLRVTTTSTMQRATQARQLLAQNRMQDAELIIRDILKTDPTNSPALHVLATIAYRVGQPDQALLLLNKALESNNASPDIYNDLGSIYAQQGRTDDAIEAFQKVVTLAPNHVDGWYNLGLQLFNTGLIEESIAHFKKATSLNSTFAEAHSFALYALNFLPTATADYILSEHRQWNLSQAKHLSANLPPHTNDRSPTRRLRIGYVSPDFRDHVVGRNLIPLFKHHDRAQFEIFCYSNTIQPDAITQTIHDAAHTWRDTFTLSDQQLADQIRADHIDILVDLSLHMAGNRLLTFARKPAPVQVTFAGYPGTTGLDTIDYRLTDPHLDPVDKPTPYSETSIRLPDSFWCFDPIDAPLPVIEPSHVLFGNITFGCLNNFIKINPPTIELWSRILKAVPQSRLQLLTVEGSHRTRTLDAFRHNGITAERIEFLPLAPRPRYLQYFHSIDICLDTLPYNGHTTTLDSLWMGVPVITLVGNTVVGRAALSQLTNLNLPELIAHTPDQYLQIATTLANDMPRLSALRATLRPRLQASPLMDAKSFATNIESVFRTMWKNHCSK